MGEDAADEAVSVFVVLLLVEFQSLIDFLCCLVSVVHYLKMKFLKGLVQSLWKVKQEKSYWTSLVVQWLRICLPLQGAWVRSWPREVPHSLEQLSPGHGNNWSLHTLVPLLCKKRSCHEKPTHHRETSPHSLQLEKVHTWKWRSNAAKSK